MTNDEAILSLQALLAAASDSETGFAARARRLGNPEWRAVIALRAEECEHSTRDMRRLLHTLGVAPVESRRGGSAPAAWRPAGDAAGVGDDAVLEECEFDEQRSVERYQDALRADPPDALRTLLLGGLDAAWRSAGTLRALRERDRPAGRPGDGRADPHISPTPHVPHTSHALHASQTPQTSRTTQGTA